MKYFFSHREEKRGVSESLMSRNHSEVFRLDKKEEDSLVCEQHR